MNDQQRTAPKVSLEDLLRLKRAERPPAEFWVEFEQNLRAKQLAAIVDKRPWWFGLRSAFKWTVPLGAAGAVAATVMTWNMTTVSQQAPTPSEIPARATELAHAAAQPAESVSTQDEAVLVAQADSQPARAIAITTAPDSHTEADVSVQPAEPARVGTHLASVAEQIAGITSAREVEADSSTRFASVSSTTPADAPSFGAFFERAVAQLDAGFRPARQPSVEPLTQVQSPGDARRARLLAFTSPVDSHSPQYTNASNVIRSRERITNRLNDEALYDSIRRLGVMGNGVSIQF